MEKQRTLKEITPRSQDFSQWYLDVVLKAELADYGPVKGCMIIRPNGYAIWEKMQQALDGMFKETGHQNAYFPMLIPESFLKKEAEHVEGFAPEVAVVTHAGGQKLEEPLVIRPTSETIIWNTYKNWIQSYRDLPLLLNQWCNVVRWEMRTRLFLRTTEFLWQEGHTAHATYEDAEEEALRILGVYRRLSENYIALPVIEGLKTETEKFAGAHHTYSIEAMMGDGKALQAGTSHHLGQNFAKAFDVTFQTEKGNREYVYATSWGLTTRMIGALIMAHGDDNGIVIPPRLATTQVVVVPIFRKPEERERVIQAVENFTAPFSGAGIGFKIDVRDQYSPGWKFNDWEKRGVPLRIEVGPKDLEKNQVVLARRDNGQKSPASQEDLAQTVLNTLETIQKSLFERARDFRDKHSYRIDDYSKFNEILDREGGFLWSHWCGSGECEERVKDDTKATIRNIPMHSEAEEGKCIKCGSRSERRVIFARAY